MLEHVATTTQKRLRTATAEHLLCNVLATEPKIPKLACTSEKQAARLDKRACEADDAMDRSLTNLEWLCEMRLNPRLEAEAVVPSCQVTAAKDSSVRPDLSYADLIVAVMDKKDGLTLLEIYTLIMDKFPYYKDAEPSWKNSVRYNLSQNKLFRKAPSAGNAQKGLLWALSGKAADQSSIRRVKKSLPQKAGMKKVASTAIVKAEPCPWEEAEATPTRTAADKEDAARAESASAASGDEWEVASAGDAHPWAEASSIAAAASGDCGDPMAASLASCLSIWPLSASALAAESLIGDTSLEFSLGGTGAVDLSRALFDETSGELLQDVPVPRDWL